MKHINIKSLLKISALGVFFLSAFSTKAQLYFFNEHGDANLLVQGHHTITNTGTNRAGAIWSENKINLSEPFKICFEANFGDVTNTGKGLAFVFKKDLNDVLGDPGMNLGYASPNPNAITPSLAIEFDTENDAPTDIDDHHIQLVKNAQINAPLTSPAALNGGAIKTDEYYNITIDWDPSNTELKVFFNNVLVLQETVDMYGTIFYQQEVYWGITGSADPGSTDAKQEIKLIGNTNFTTYNDAQFGSSKCYSMVDDQPQELGAIWNNTPIDMNYDFNICFDAFFGSKDNGADGLAFVLNADPTNVLGAPFGGLGYTDLYGNAKISNSIAIEFDCNDDAASNDLADDHTAIVLNADHNNPIPGSLVSFGKNLEDGTFHNCKITWEAATTTFKIYLDNALILTQAMPFNPTLNYPLYWGFTASTGFSTSNTIAICNINETCCGTPSNVPSINCQLDLVRLRFDEGYDDGLATQNSSFNSVKVTADCDVVTAGKLIDPAFDYPVLNSMASITKVDAGYSEEWSMVYTNTSKIQGEFNNIIELSTGELLAVGIVKETPAKALVVKTDASGNIVWSKKMLAESEAIDAEEAPNGDIIVGGNVENFAFVQRFSPIGTELWSNKYYLENGMELEALEAIDTDADGFRDDGIVICGSVLLTGDWHGYVIELNPTGGTLGSNYRLFPNSPINDIKQVDLDANGLLNPNAYAIIGTNKEKSVSRILIGVLATSDKIQLIEDTDGLDLEGVGVEQQPDNDLAFAVNVNNINDSPGYLCTSLALKDNRSIYWKNEGKYEEHLKSIAVTSNDTYVLVGETDKDNTGNFNPFIISQYKNAGQVCMKKFSPKSTRSFVKDQKNNITFEDISTASIAMINYSTSLYSFYYCDKVSKKETASSVQNQLEKTDSSTLLYPNPIVEGQRLNLKSESMEGETTVVISDLLGKTLFNSTLEVSIGSPFQLPTQNLSTGSYIVTLKNQNSIENIQFSIVR